MQGDILYVKWKSSDPDGDPLSHVIRYSADGGLTWNTVGFVGPVDHAEIYMRERGETKEGVISVIASDGLRAATAATRDTFEFLLPTTKAD